MGRDICLDLFNVRLDLLAGFLAGLIQSILQMRDLLLQGVNVLSHLARLANAHFVPRYFPRLACHRLGQTYYHNSP
jgi:hypothetical protein